MLLRKQKTPRIVRFLLRKFKNICPSKVHVRFRPGQRYLILQGHKKSIWVAVIGGLKVPLPPISKILITVILKLVTHKYDFYFIMYRLKWRQVSATACDRRMPLKIKGKIYKTYIIPVVLYRSEYWNIGK